MANRRPLVTVSGRTQELPATDTLDVAIVSGANILINGGGDFWQRHQAAGVAVTTLAAFADAAYCADRWVNLTDGGASDIQFAQVAGDTNSQNALQFKQVNASAKKAGISQWIESANTIPLRGKTVRFQFRVKSSSTPTIRAAILEWTGTADLPSTARDLVNNWANSGDANPATTFFKTTTINVLGSITGSAASGSYADVSVTGTVGSSANNLIVVLWTNGTLAQNVTVNVAEAGLYEGSSARNWQPIPAALEKLRVLRFYEVFVDNEVIVCRGYQQAGANMLLTLNFGAPKRVNPTAAKLGTWTVINCAQPTVTVNTGNNQTFQIYSPATATGDLYFDSFSGALGTGLSFDAEI